VSAGVFLAIAGQQRRIAGERGRKRWAEAAACCGSAQAHTHRSVDTSAQFSRDIKPRSQTQESWQSEDRRDRPGGGCRKSVGSGIRPTFRINLPAYALLDVAAPARPASNETEFGAKMKLRLPSFSFSESLVFSSGQKSAPTTRRFPPSIGLEVGQPAPSFALSDQFGHQQSNETLKGSKALCFLFFSFRRIGDPSCKAQARAAAKRKTKI